MRKSRCVMIPYASSSPRSSSPDSSVPEASSGLADCRDFRGVSRYGWDSKSCTDLNAFYLPFPSCSFPKLDYFRFTAIPVGPFIAIILALLTFGFSVRADISYPGDYLEGSGLHTGLRSPSSSSAEETSSDHQPRASVGIKFSL